MQDIPSEEPTERGFGNPEQDDLVTEVVPPTPEAMEAADKLVRQANLAKIRGQGSVADKLLQEAITIAPNSPSILLAIADDYAERKQFTKAREAYKKALDADPGNKAVETKYAELVLKTNLPTDPFEYMAQADAGSMASGAAAVILNVFFPGLGQIVAGKVTKGAVFLIVAIVCWAGVLLMPGGMPAVFAYVTSGRRVDGFSTVSLLFLGVGVMNWLFALVDASAAAKRFKPAKVERPAIPDISEFIKKD